MLSSSQTSTAPDRCARSSPTQPGWCALRWHNLVGYYTFGPSLPPNHLVRRDGGLLSPFSLHRCVSASLACLQPPSHTSVLRAPVTQDIKAIGETVSDESFVDDMKKLASEAAPSHPVEVRWRDKGRFRSVTMRCTFRSADEVYALYASLDADKRVKFKL
eukprot:scaffold268391_cov32-Tisochrysis_lutea.AAC.1